jgi:hypothetical protein
LISQTPSNHERVLQDSLNAARVHQGEVVESKGAAEAAAPEGEKTPTPSREVQRGRILTFIPKNQKVTIVRENVGLTYNGDVIHEVVLVGDGRLFLASMKQLK